MLTLRQAAVSAKNRECLANMACTKLGLRVRVLRIYNNLQREDLAYRLQIPVDALARFEENRNEPCKILLRKIAQFFQVPPEELVASV